MTNNAFIKLMPFKHVLTTYIKYMIQAEKH